MTNAERAVSNFKKGFSCSQSVLSAYGPKLGLSRAMALKVAGAFGGGMGRMGSTCGAVTGSFMVIGLKYGAARVENLQEKEKVYGYVREFVKRFTSLNGSIICKELLKCDLSTMEGVQTAIEKQLFVTVCPKLVQDATNILDQLLSS